MTKLRIFATVLAFATVSSAKEAKFYQKGKLVQMQSVSCGTEAKSGQSLAGTVLGTDSGHTKTRDMLCQEYVLSTGRVTYRIRPRDEKHPALLPIGETAEFRIKKDRLYLRVVEMDDQEREYFVLSMAPTSPAVTAENAPTR
jgi:hypothetical protein